MPTWDRKGHCTSRSSSNWTRSNTQTLNYIPTWKLMKIHLSLVLQQLLNLFDICKQSMLVSLISLLFWFCSLHMYVEIICGSKMSKFVFAFKDIWNVDWFFVCLSKQFYLLISIFYLYFCYNTLDTPALD